LPVINTTQEKQYPFQVHQAGTFFSRLIGLAGSSRPDPESALWVKPCTRIHTFGMAYPLDVLYLDETGKVIRALSNVKPNTIPAKSARTVSVLEFPSGILNDQNIREGDQLDVVSDTLSRPRLSVLSNLLHWPVNLLIALLWSRLVAAALQYGITFPNPMHFGILIHNTLLMVFFLTRRKSLRTSSRFTDWAVSILTLCAAMLLRPVVFVESPMMLPSAVLQYVGIAGIITALLSLGRSFGIVPANRKVVCSGMYRLIRHPMYISEIIFYSGFVLGNPTLKNVVLIVLVLTGQIWRALSEENLLCSDPSYRAYMESVRFRFIPGVF
jgi:protein-S-isoprenylcysteine O-methyltransferase Ste14/uncharacterized membrane protein (UPF0127 family)